MKITLNKTNRGFTLIEMIGVLAVIAILAAVLIPKVFEAINNSRVSNAVMTCNTVKTAIADHYAKFGTLGVDGSTPTAPVSFTTTNDFDKILLSEGFLDKPFAVKIGDGNDANNNVVLAQAPAAATVGIDDHLYDLDGNSIVDTAEGTSVVEAVITGASLEDASAVDRLIDGSAATMSSPSSTGTDMQGRVKWIQSTATPGTYIINVYLTHR